MVFTQVRNMLANMVNYNADMRIRLNHYTQGILMQTMDRLESIKTR